MDIFHIGSYLYHLRSNCAFDRFRDKFFPDVGRNRNCSVAFGNFISGGILEESTTCGKGHRYGRCVYWNRFFCFVEGCVISQMHAKGKAGLDYIIVLGAQVRENGPSPVLKYRLDKAVEYLEENPDTICIVSGGQGKNEPWSEAEGMAQYLKTQGIDENRIRLEDQSLTTEQNVTNSQKLMEEGASVGIVTNDFHVFRAKQIAKKYGLKDVCGIAAGSSPLYLPNNMLREFFAEIKFLVF